MRRRDKSSDRRINWDRVRRIFDNPRPPQTVWERQFDYFDSELRRIAHTPYTEFDLSNLWYYYHDLNYVELQPDLFDYLFPVCLMDWHVTLQRNAPCSHGDADFHRALRTRNLLETMMDTPRREAICDYFRDSFCERLDAERGFVYSGSGTPAFGWIGRFNSLGLVLPHIKPFWDAWWSMETPGRAVAALQYCSDLMYGDSENPLFPPWTPDRGGGGPYIWQNDSMIYDGGWIESNLDFLRATLTTEFVNGAVTRATARLQGEPEHETARRLEDDLPRCQDRLTLRIDELPTLLAKPTCMGWSV